MRMKGAAPRGAPAGTRGAGPPTVRPTPPLPDKYGPVLALKLKVSNLILNMNLVLKDVPTGAVLSGGSVDIRGNVDESWRRGLDRLLRNQGLVATSAGRAGQQ